MPKPRIVFTNASGVSRTLQSDYPDPASRLKNWHGDVQPVGDFAHDLATETLHRFRTSWRYGCHFEMHGLRMGAFNASSFAASPKDIALELRQMLLNGSSCALYTEDAYGNSYATLGLMPGTMPEVFLVNRRTMEYGLRLSLINLAASPTAIECHYQTGYERIAYFVDQGSNIYSLEYGAEPVDADAFLKLDSGSIYVLDSDRAEKDLDALLVDADSLLVVI